MLERSRISRLYWTLRDYARRVWDNSGDDNIFFLAGGISFNVMLVGVPFFLLLVTSLAVFLNHSPDVSTAEALALVDRLLPPHEETSDSPVHQMITDVLKLHGSVGLYSAIGFIWFSTRLFGSLRSVLASVFDIEIDRGIIAGKLFDAQITLLSTLFAIAYTVLSAYLAIATTRGVAVLSAFGLRDDVMGGVEYSLGRLLAFAFVVATFFLLYKYLPNRRIRWKTALVGSLSTAVLFEIARSLFGVYVSRFNPGSLYTGTLYGLIILVFWVYYGSLIFILGGEVAQVYELRRVRRMQRETFE